MSTIIDKQEAGKLLKQYVGDEYQRIHAQMVAQALEGYAHLYKEDPALWWLTGYLHDVDYHLHPDTHPACSLEWFKEWDLPDELIHAVEAHALGFNGFDTQPQTNLARVLIACDEISGIFYAYQKLNPIPFGSMKVSSIQKRLKDKGFAPGIDREHIYSAIDRLGLSTEEHIKNLINFFSALDKK